MPPLEMGCGLFDGRLVPGLHIGDDRGAPGGVERVRWAGGARLRGRHDDDGVLVGQGAEGGGGGGEVEADRLVGADGQWGSGGPGGLGQHRDGVADGHRATAEKCTRGSARRICRICFNFYLNSDFK